MLASQNMRCGSEQNLGEMSTLSQGYRPTCQPANLPKRNGLPESAKKDGKKDLCNALIRWRWGIENDGVSRLQEGSRLPCYVCCTCLLWILCKDPKLSLWDIQLSIWRLQMKHNFKYSQQERDVFWLVRSGQRDEESDKFCQVLGQ